MFAYLTLVLQQNSLAFDRLLSLYCGWFHQTSNTGALTNPISTAVVSVIRRGFAIRPPPPSAKNIINSFVTTLSSALLTRISSVFEIIGN